MLTPRLLQTSVPQVYKANTENLKTYVVCAGLVYGLGESEDVFHGLFKDAWHCKPLSHSGDGENVVPTIHVADLCSAVTKIAQDPAPETARQRYVLAVDAGADSLKTIVGAIASTVGTGEVAPPTGDQVLESSASADYLGIDQKLSSTVLPELIPEEEWVCGEGFVAGVGTAVSEYREKRNLLPVCVAPLSVDVLAWLFSSKRRRQWTLNKQKLCRTHPQNN